MHLVWRLSAGVCCTAALIAPRVWAQPAPPTALPPPAPLPPPVAPAPLVPPPPAESPLASPPASTSEAPVAAPESLETPYAETPPPARPAAPGAPRPGKPGTSSRPSPDTRPLLPIRDRRKLALLGEIGWNGLAGFGMILTYHVNPHVSLDLGGGFSLFGWKAGLRGRYNLLKSPMTPFLGAGFNATSGLGELSSDPKDDSSADPNSQPFTINVKASYLVQAVIGFDFIHKHGFNMQGAVGYAWLLNKNNLELVDGSLTREERRAFDIIFKSGLVLSLAWGYAFE